MITPAAVPTSIDAAPATAAPPATAAEAGAGAFDAILLLQGLAATTDVLDTATFEAGDTADALATDDPADEDGEDEIETSLAFLADLIAISAVKTANQGAGDSASFAGGEGAANDDAIPLTATTAGTDAGFALAADAEGGKADLLPGLSAVLAEPAEQRTASGDASQNLARAVEMLAQPRVAVAEAGKPTLLTHARDPRWADDFSARVSLMVRAGESTASLAMTPVDLGPVEVKVTVKDAQATIQFAATQADTRALIEGSLPRLRELLASQGFNLLDASVSSGFSRQQSPAFASTTRGGASGEAETSTTEARVTRQLSLLDLYA